MFWFISAFVESNIRCQLWLVLEIQPCTDWLVKDTVAQDKSVDLRSDDPVDPPLRIWLSTSSVSLVLAMLFLICIIDS